MCPRNHFDYSAEDIKIQGILIKELKDKWLTEHARFAPITEFESPESPPCTSSSLLPRYSPISPALSRHSGYTPITNCSPISSNPSRYSNSLSESSDESDESSDESDESSDESSSKAFTWATFPSPTSPRPSPSNYSTISDSDLFLYTSPTPFKIEFYNTKAGDYSDTWDKSEEPEPMDEDMEKNQDLDDIDENLAWLRPNKLSSGIGDQDEDLDDIDQSLAWLKTIKLVKTK